MLETHDQVVKQLWDRGPGLVEFVTQLLTDNAKESGDVNVTTSQIMSDEARSKSIKQCRFLKEFWQCLRKEDSHKTKEQRACVYF